MLLLPDPGAAARRARAALVACCFFLLPVLARAETGGEYIPPALAIPALASRAEAFVPDGYTFEREVVGDLGGGVPGVAQVYHDASGRRALLIGLRRPQGFEATGWGFILPCMSCGVDLPAERNLDLQIRDRRVVVIDRSASKADGTTTDAELALNYDAASRRWLLATLSQRTVYTDAQRADESLVDYEHGTTRDASGTYVDGVFTPDSTQEGKADAQQPGLDTLTLY